MTPLPRETDSLPLRPLRREEATLLVKGKTGEVLGWRGLNADEERCPATLCGDCPRHCRCAPCLCDDCTGRAAHARRPAAVRGQPQLVFTL